MKTHPTIIVVAGLLFLFTLISGLSLSRNLRHNDPRASGKPLAGALPALHKLVAIATVIIVAVTIRNLHRGMEFGGMELSAVIFTGLFFLADVRHWQFAKPRQGGKRSSASSS
jgi:hypothetical protein